MKPLLLRVFSAVSVLCLLVACGDPPIVPDPPPAKVKAKPKVYQAPDLAAEAALREAALEKEIAGLEAQGSRLRQEIAEEELALDRAALEEERRLLEQERADWLRTGETTAVTGPVKEDDASRSPACDYSLFYKELAPYGRWFESVDYGYVWQPTVAADLSWRPYTMGQWGACDRGWTWLSDEPFGWAAYHYGRWTRVKHCGWIWVPGEVWAPAWVTWRRSDQYVGWCPLPPETLYSTTVTYDSTVDRVCGLSPASYIFIPVKHFGKPAHQHCEPPERSALVCRSTTNITRLAISRHRVDCGGPKYEWIKQHSPRPPARYTLTSDRRSDGDRQFRIDRGQLCVFDPVMRAPWNASLRPPRVEGVLTPDQAEPQGAVVPDKTRQRFREERKAWMAAAERTLKLESMRHLTERQHRVAAMEVSLGNAKPPGANPRPPSPPGRPPGATEANSTDPATSQGGSARPSLSQRKAQRQEGLEELAGRKAELERLRSQMTSNGTNRSPVTVIPRESAAPVSMETRTGKPTDPSPDLRERRASAERMNQELIQKQQVIQQQREAARVARIQVEPATPAPQPGMVEQPTPGAVSEEGTPAITPPELALRAQNLAQQRAAADLLQAKRAALKLEQQQAAEERSRQQQLVRDGEVQQEEAARQQQVQQQEQQQEQQVTEARQREAMQQAREEQAALLQQQQREAMEQAAQEQAARQQQQQRDAMEQAGQELAARQQQQQRDTVEQARQEQAARQQQQQRDAVEQARQEQAARLQQQQREAMEQARQEQAARLHQQQQEAMERARQEQAARQQQMQLEAEVRQREAMERARQEQAARQQQMQLEAEARQREAMERARQEQEARQRQMQLEAEARQREAMERARQEQAARQQQQLETEARQREAMERARQEEAARRQQEQQQREAAERARQEAAARAAAEAARQGK